MCLRLCYQAAQVAVTLQIACQNNDMVIPAVLEQGQLTAKDGGNASRARCVVKADDTRQRIAVSDSTGVITEFKVALDKVLYADGTLVKTEAGVDVQMSKGHTSPLMPAVSIHEADHVPVTVNIVSRNCRYHPILADNGVVGGIFCLL